MKNFLLRNKWWFYFILAYLISWPVWALGKAVLPANLSVVTMITGAFGPFAAAIILTRIEEGISGLKTWFKISFNLRIGLKWYLLGAVLLPFLIAVIHHLIYIILGGDSGIELSFN